MRYYDIKIDRIESINYIIDGFSYGDSRRLSKFLIGVCRVIDTDVADLLTKFDILKIVFSSKDFDDEALEILLEEGALITFDEFIDGKKVYYFHTKYFQKCLSDKITYEKSMSLFEFIYENTNCERTLL